MKQFDLSPALQSKLEKTFLSSPLSTDQAQRIEKINEKFQQLARSIALITPESNEQTRMIEKLQEAKLLAVESIAKNEL